MFQYQEAIEANYSFEYEWFSVDKPSESNCLHSTEEFITTLDAPIHA